MLWLWLSRAGRDAQRQALLEATLDHEAKYWTGDGLSRDQVEPVLAVITLWQGLAPGAMRDLIERWPNRDSKVTSADPTRLAERLRRLYPAEQGAIAPLLPDPLGEAVILRTLAQYSQVLVQAALGPTVTAPQRQQAFESGTDHGFFRKCSNETEYTRQSLVAGFVLLLAGALLQPAMAGPDDDRVPHRVVIQVSTADPQAHRIALNNAVNLQKVLGMDNVSVELVAYGPGLVLMTPDSPESSRIPSLSLQEIRFSACGNTMKKVEAKTGKAPTLVEGVSVVPAGVVRIMELQEQGYTYIRP